MARQQLSVEERRRRNREYQKKRREKIHSEAELKEEYLRAERQRWKKRVEEGKLKNINDLNEREKRSQRKAWKRRQQVSREGKRKGPDQAIHEPARSRQAIAGERERKKTRARYSREVKALRNKLQEVTKDRNKMKKRWVREQARTKNHQEKKQTIKQRANNTLEAEGKACRGRVKGRGGRVKRGEEAEERKDGSKGVWEETRVGGAVGRGGAF